MSAARQPGRGGLELIEEAIHLLRLAPTGALVCYYAGTLPFVLGLLYFWADMSRSAFARDHCAAAALGLALLFAWMKAGQVAFTRRLRMHLGEVPAAGGLARWLRLLTAQTILQATALFVLPVALLTALPFGWAYAFYQNVTVLGDGEDTTTGAVFRRACAQARLWPGQNHLVLAVLLPFGLFIWVNLLTGFATAPELLRMFLGIETPFTQSTDGLLNSTFFAALFAVTWLCVDPILKTVYTLRCFYGAARETGADLRAELKQHQTLAKLAALLLATTVLLGTGAARAAESSSPETSVTTPAQLRSALPPADLDRSITEILNQREFAWRLPRDGRLAEDEESKNFLVRFLDEVRDTLRDWWQRFKDFLERWLRPRRAGSPESSGLGWITSLQGMLFLLLAATACGVGLVLFRMWRRRRLKSGTAVAEAIQALPDLADENVGAEQLPEDRWLTLARELMGRGELRLALRAFYLASLAHLAARGLIALARFKSNHDYARELGRRGHAFPELLAAFAGNVGVFDRVWYGRHEISESLLAEFAARVERMRAC